MGIREPAVPTTRRKRGGSVKGVGGPDRLWLAVCLPAFVKFSWAPFAVLSAGFKLWFFDSAASVQVVWLEKKEDTGNCWCAGSRLVICCVLSWKAEVENSALCLVIGLLETGSHCAIQSWDQPWGIIARFLLFMMQHIATLWLFCCSIFGLSLSRYDFYVVLSVHNKWIIVLLFV
jgi:hypothetical protein